MPAVWAAKGATLSIVKKPETGNMAGVVLLLKSRGDGQFQFWQENLRNKSARVAEARDGFIIEREP